MNYQLACTISGLRQPDAPCLLLVHGFGEDRRIWDGLARRLGEHYKIVMPDLPGFGQSPPLPGWRMEDAADFLGGLLQRNGIKRCLYVGHSMGGYVGAAFAKRFAHALSGIMFFHSTAYPDSPETLKQRRSTIRFLENNGPKPFINNFLKKLLIEAFRLEHSKTANVLKERALAYPPEAWTAATRAMLGRPESLSVLEHLGCPVGYLAGKKDAFIDYRQNLRECHLAKVGFVRILPTASHAAMFEAPEAAENALREFAGFCFAAK